MSIDQQPKMSANQPPTPLELAHLSAALIQAKIVTQTSTLNDIAEALQYLDSCEEALVIHETERNAETENKRIRAFLSEYDLTEGQKLEIPSAFIEGAAPVEARPVPMERIVTFCQAHRTKPDTSELEAIKESRRWTALSKIDKFKAIFLVLTQDGCPWPVGYAPAEMEPGMDELRMLYPENLKKRRRWLKNGVPFDEAEIHIRILLNAMHERPRIKGKKGAESKRHKPRAPRSGQGRFEEKQRDIGGVFRKQKK
ncbi:MAG: hypothetical protein ACYC67_22385 [Prosthecobacter sp.]